ncbi:DNA-binding protein [Ciceribacter naphthalenivorans]|uniref:DNA-binding protein n=3 Tax=Alphaproteobacteria TaxID=28211 RepID=A0A512HIR8_9HYPH|nr:MULTISPECIES: RNA-binding protein [Alphaproteobacteria]GEO85334.1 DNA-binding protein [Ciceribacter naphthalenivorans]GLR20973.1 DNA-binding protein [Ciceribacter naphthalenivorans]GLT03829.1 DNA-binding protein [Sphingomonas psychrolutea]
MSEPAPDTAHDEEDFDVGEVNGRMCIATRESGSPETLIRFVAAPDGSIVPDLKRALPGRGCWVSPSRAAVDKAVAKKLFARALKRDVKADPNLGETVDRLLAQQLAGMMNLARKAGQFVTGSAKVEAAVRSGQAIAVFHSTEAATDGVRKIDQARKAWHLGMETEAEIPSYRLLTGAEMDELMGQNAFIHACALAGQAGEGVVKRANVLEQYRTGGLPQKKDVVDMPKQ